MNPSLLFHLPLDELLQRNKSKIATNEVAVNTNAKKFALKRWQQKQTQDLIEGIKMIFSAEKVSPVVHSSSPFH